MIWSLQTLEADEKVWDPDTSWRHWHWISCCRKSLMESTSSLGKLQSSTAFLLALTRTWNMENQGLSKEKTCLTRQPQLGNHSTRKAFQKRSMSDGWREKERKKQRADNWNRKQMKQFTRRPQSAMKFVVNGKTALWKRANLSFCLWELTGKGVL